MYVPYFYPVVSRGRIPFAGGIEVQLSLLAKGLVERGFDVTVVTCDYGQADGIVVDGVKLLRCYRPDAGLPILRFLHPRVSTSIAALHRANADVYLVQGAGLYAGLVADVARAMGRRFVFMSAADHDVSRELPDVNGPRDRIWYRRGLAGASAILVQTAKQRALLRDAYGYDGLVIMNPVDIPNELAAPAASRRVVWVATYKASKRPEWFTRLAERHPDLECAMVGVVPTPPLTDADFVAATAVARRCPNLTVHGPLAHERVNEFLSGAALFTHTSPAEGFPNTFLEAWSIGLPTVTCFDPDGIIARERLGERHETFEAWEEAVLRWMSDPEGRAAAGARARAYARATHGSGEIHERVAEVMDRLVALRRAGR